MDYTEDQIAEAARAFRIQRSTATDILRVTKVSNYSTLPSYGSGHAAGLDVYADLSSEGAGVILIQPGKRRLLKTGIAIATPNGHYARIAPRSGLAFMSGIDVMAGVVDEDYRGEVGVILINLGDEPFPVKHGDRIAQLIIEKYTPCLVTEVSDLPDTVRGEGGWGSTGN